MLARGRPYASMNEACVSGCILSSEAVALDRLTGSQSTFREVPLKTGKHTDALIVRFQNRRLVYLLTEEAQGTLDFPQTTTLLPRKPTRFTHYQQSCTC